MIEFINNFDYTTLKTYHELAVKFGWFFTPLAKFMTFIGEKGVTFLIITFVLLLFTKTRKQGVALFGAISCSFLCTDLILKVIVERARPFMSTVYPEFREWWEFVKGINEEGSSFPSGHAACAAAGFLTIAIVWDKRALWVGIPYAAIMCFSRNYLMAHYPSDVIAGLFVGIMSSVISYGITLAIYWFLNKIKNTGFAKFILEDFDAGKIYLKIKSKKSKK